mgnify:CR=1 FL=1
MKLGIRFGLAFLAAFIAGILVLAFQADPVVQNYFTSLDIPLPGSDAGALDDAGQPPALVLQAQALDLELEPVALWDGLPAERLLGAQERDLVVERLAGGLRPG